MEKRMWGKSGNVCEKGEKEEHKYKEYWKGKNEAEIDKKNLHLKKLVYLGMGGKRLV